MATNGGGSERADSNDSTEMQSKLQQQHQQQRTVRDHINEEKNRPKQSHHQALYNLLARPGIPPYHSIQTGDRDASSVPPQATAIAEDSNDRFEMEAKPDMDPGEAGNRSLDRSQSDSSSTSAAAAEVIHPKKKFLQRQKREEERVKVDVKVEQATRAISPPQQLPPVSRQPEKQPLTNALDICIEKIMNEPSGSKSQRAVESDGNRPTSGKSTPSSNNGGQTQSQFIDEQIRRYLHHDEAPASSENSANHRSPQDSKKDLTMTIGEVIHQDIERNCRQPSPASLAYDRPHSAAAMTQYRRLPPQVSLLIGA